LTSGHEVAPKKVETWGRFFHIPQLSTNGIAKVSFQELCGEAHSAADFLALASQIKVLVLTDIPKMSVAHRNEARRFITLMDTLYENKIKLVCSAEAPIVDLLSGEPLKSARLDSSERLLMDDLKLSTEQVICRKIESV
jgi:protein AFG1